MQKQMKNTKQIIYVLTLCFSVFFFADIVFSESPKDLPTPESIVKDMEGMVFTYAFPNYIIGQYTNFSAKNASNPKISDVLSNINNGFAKITISMDYIQEGDQQKDVKFIVVYQLFDQGWRIYRKGGINGVGGNNEWVAFSKHVSEVKENSVHDSEKEKKFESDVQQLKLKKAKSDQQQLELKKYIARASEILIGTWAENCGNSNNRNVSYYNNGRLVYEVFGKLNNGTWQILNDKIVVLHDNVNKQQTIWQITEMKENDYIIKDGRRVCVAKRTK